MNYIAKVISPQTPAEQASEILNLLRPLLRQCEGLVRESTVEDVTPAMFRLLACLHVEGAQTAPALARSLGTGRQYIQRMVNELLPCGLIERKKNPAHRTSWIIALTEKGLLHVQRVTSHEHTALAALADGVTGEELQACLNVLDHFMNQLGGRDHPRVVTHSDRQPLREQSVRAEESGPEELQERQPIAPLKQPHEQAFEPEHEESEKGGIDVTENEHARPAAVLNWNGSGGLRIG